MIKVQQIMQGYLQRLALVNVLLYFFVPRVHTRRGKAGAVLSEGESDCVSEGEVDGLSMKVSINLIYVLLYYSHLSLYPECTQEDACHPPGWCCVERG